MRVGQTKIASSEAPLAAKWMSVKPVSDDRVTVTYISQARITVS